MTLSKVQSTDKGHSAKVMICNGLGLHLRPASQLVKLASKFEACELTLTKNGQTINAKSIMGVIMLAAEQGSEIMIEANGDNSADAVAALVAMIESGFGET